MENTVLVLGGDGFVGWPTALRLSNTGYDVVIVDNLARRKTDIELECESLTPIQPLGTRIEAWQEVIGECIKYYNFDISDNYHRLLTLIKKHKPTAIIHLAEQRAAPYSMKSSYHKRYTVNNNLNATNNVLCAIVESGIDTHLVHLGCYDDKTEIFTQDGWKLFKDLDKNDFVATRTENDRTLLFKKPKSIHVYDHEGKMYRIKGTKIDSSVTPNHRIFTQKRSNNDYKELRLEYANDIFHKERSFDVGFKWKGKYKEYIDLCGRKIRTTTFLRFFGWFLSEGHCIQNRVVIKQKKNTENLSILKEDLDIFCNEFGINLSQSEDNGCICFSLCNKELKEELSIFGKSEEKYIPLDVKNLSKYLLSELLDTLILGDGTIHGRGFKYYTISEKLADDVQEICLKCGWSATITMGTSQNSKMNIVYISPASHYVMNRNKNKYNDWWEDYNGKVYCVDVGDGHGIVFVRRNKKVFWSGNTTGYYGYSDVGMTIPEGYLPVKVDVDGQEKEIEIMYPPNPGSIYHMTKSQDAISFLYFNKNDKVRITDLHQGIVWGTQTEETKLDSRLINRFDYDGDYGTVLNRFLMQSQVNHPLTVYGTGGQTRAFIHIQNSVECIELAVKNPPMKGDRVRIFNQTTECLNINDLAIKVSEMTNAEIRYYNNPRNEDPKNDLKFNNEGLLNLGLKPITLDDGLIEEVIHIADKYKSNVIIPKIICTSVWSKDKKIDYNGKST